MLHRMIYSIMAAVLGCSLVADPDDFNYIEGSATDNEGASDSETDADTERDTDGDTATETDRDSDEGEDTDDTDTASDPPLSLRECRSDDDCTAPLYCPRFFDNSVQEEVTSHCYLDCGEGDAVCDDTPMPYCYRNPQGAACLARASIVGEFTCRRGERVEGNTVALRLGEDVTPVILDECEMTLEATGVRFIFRTRVDNRVIEAIFQLSDLNIGDLTVGGQEGADGMVFGEVMGTDGGETTPMARFIRGVFPGPEPPQDPELKHEFDINEVTLVGPIRGDVDFEGFVYDAEILLAQ